MLIGCICCHGPTDRRGNCPICNQEEFEKGESEYYMNENNIAQLIPTKSDKDLADEIRAKILDVYKPVIETLTYAKKSGFDVMVQTGADGFGQVHVMDVKIVKNY